MQLFAGPAIAVRKPTALASAEVAAVYAAAVDRIVSVGANVVAATAVKCSTLCMSGCTIQQPTELQDDRSTSTAVSMRMNDHVRSAGATSALSGCQVDS
jgi:hypothetical protein